VSRSKEVPVFGPPIHEGATFPKSKSFSEFLLAKGKLKQVVIEVGILHIVVNKNSIVLNSKIVTHVYALWCLCHQEVSVKISLSSSVLGGVILINRSGFLIC
jgi:hypothetical protein